jgi:hypothetical protein
VAELFELTDQTAGAVVAGVALVLPIRTEVVVGHAVADDEVERDQDVVPGGADRLG